MLAQLKADFPEDLRVVYRHFPLTEIHDKAFMAAQASEAAGAQGKFWEMHDVLFQRQTEWAGLPVSDFEGWVTTIAGEIGLNVDNFTAAFNGDTAETAVQESRSAGEELGIPGTPFLLINGEIYTGPRDYNNLTTIIKLLSLDKIQYTECPPVVIDLDKTYIATIETEGGDIVVELLPSESPVAVNSFVFLAQEGWFNGITFHRVLEGFMAQSGDPSGTGYGGPGYTFVNEPTDRSFDQEGLFAMANAGRDTNGSQFFITTGPADYLDGDYTIFGVVQEGLDVALGLTLRNPAQNANLPPGDTIIQITIEEK